MIVDTSVWVDHLRRGVPGLASRLEEGVVYTHPFVVGELALSNLADRENFLSLIGSLPSAPMADHDEVLALVEIEGLFGRGIGWVDVHLLASALISSLPLWTYDRPLLEAAQRIGVA